MRLWSLEGRGAKRATRPRLEARAQVGASVESVGSVGSLCGVCGGVSSLRDVLRLEPLALEVGGLERADDGRRVGVEGLARRQAGGQRRAGGRAGKGVQGRVAGLGRPACPAGRRWRRTPPPTRGKTREGSRGGGTSPPDGALALLERARDANKDYD